MKRSALVAGFYLLFNMVAMPAGWGGVSSSGGTLGALEITILAGFLYILLFDLVSAGWVLTRVCWTEEGVREEGCQKGWVLVLGVLAMAGLMGARVMVDEIGRQTALGKGAGGEWAVLYVCLGLQLAYIAAVRLQRPGPSISSGS